MQDIVSEIQELKKTKKATILAHYYQEGEIQEIADFNGDSLALARAATKVETPIIVFCGVHFMAETAKILNPAKKVLLPDIQAGCSLADSCPADKLNRYQQMLRENGRDFQTVTYINSTADVKALSDWVVTSGNAREIIERVPKDKEILFVPDKHLGQYLEEVCNRKMILWDGACMVHEIFSLGDLLAMKKKVPTSLVFAHPECPANIRANSDFVGGTEAMLKKLASLKNDTDIIIATEPNMMWQMQHRFPMHRYHPVPGITCACNKCPHMARNTLEKIKDCLVNESPEILWKSTFDKAKVVLERSLLN